MPWWRVNTKYSIHQVQHTLSTAYTEYGIHQVQHTLSTASTTWCIIPRSTVSGSQPVSHLAADHVVLNSSHSHNYVLTNKYSLSSRRTSLPNYRLQIDRPQALLQSRSIMASKCISKLAQSQLPSESLPSPDYGLHVRTMMACKCIYKLARSRPPSASPNSPDHGLQVHLQTRPITASKCISKLAQHSIRVYLKPRTNTLPMFAQSPHSSASPHSLDRGLQVHLQTRSITASESISNLARIRPPSSPNHGLQLHLGTCSMTASKCISNSLDYSLETRSIMALECIPKFTRTRCYEMVEIAWHPKGIRETEWF